MKSKLFTLWGQGASSAWIKAVVILILSTIVSLIGDQVTDMISHNSFILSAIDWHKVEFGVIVAVIAYIKKEFLSDKNGNVLGLPGVGGATQDTLDAKKTMDSVNGK